LQFTRTVTITELAKITLNSLIGLIPQGFYILLLTHILPIVLGSYWLDVSVQQASENLETIANQFTANSGRESVAFRVILDTCSGFFGQFMVLLGFYFLIEVLGYFALLHLLKAYFRAKRIPTVRQALLAALKQLVPTGIICMAVIGILLIVAQVIFPPLLVFVAPALVAPVLIVNGKKSALRAVNDSIRLKFLGKAQQPERFAVMFQLLTIAATMYVSVATIAWLIQEFYVFDELAAIGNTFWLKTFGHFSFGPVYLIGNLIEIVGSAFVVMIVAAATSAVYFSRTPIVRTKK